MDKSSSCSGIKLSSLHSICSDTLKGCQVVSKGKDTFVFAIDNKGFLHILNHEKVSKTLSPIRKINAHKRGISDIAYIPSWKGKETIITSSLDCNAYFWEFDDLISDPQKIQDSDIEAFGVFTARNNICKIVPLRDQRIAFISWDNKTYIINESGDKIALEHGKLSAWDICEIGDCFVTAEASSSISVWSINGKKLHEKKNAHASPARGIFQYKDNLYSIGCDGCMMKWILQEDKSLKLENSLTITDTYLYKYDVIDNYCFISSEDKAIYEVDLDKFEVSDVFVTGSISWGITHESKTEIYTAESSGVIYIFSSLPEMRANPDIEEKYFEALSSTKLRNSVLEKMEPSDFPADLEEYPKPGIFYTIYRDGIQLYIYSFSYNKWLCTGYIEKQKKPKVKDQEGNEWDTSITVMLEDDTVYELYVNYNSDPLQIAQNFVQKHKLSQNFIQQIKEFVEENVTSKNQTKSSPPKQESGAFCNGKIKFGTAEMAGRRGSMEDFSITFEDKETNSSFFCVFDGHGSDKPSKYAGIRFKEIALQLLKDKTTQDKDLLFKVLMKLREEMNQFDICGSCAVCVFIRDNKMYMANLGDSRCLLCRKLGEKNTVQQISVDHLASSEEAIKYAEEHGGHVINGRLSSILAVSRFLGDSVLAPLAIPEPTCKELILEKNDRILLACDGVFDVLSNEQVCDLVLDFGENPMNSAVKVRDTAYDLVSYDNISAIVISYDN